MKELSNKKKEEAPKGYEDSIYREHTIRVINEKIESLSSTFDIQPDFQNPHNTAIRLAVNQAVIIELQDLIEEL